LLALQMTAPHSPCYCQTGPWRTFPYDNIIYWWYR